MTYQFITTNTPTYEQVLALRQLVLRAPLGMNLMEEDLRDEVHQVIAVAFVADAVVGCLMAKELPGGRWKLRQMAVDPSYQLKGIGGGLMAFMEAAANARGIAFIELHARETAVGFYEKLGYEVSGEQFKEVGIPHWFMQKNMNR